LVAESHVCELIIVRLLHEVGVESMTSRMRRVICELKRISLNAELKMMRMR